jgi:hypothetical protein
MRQTVTFKDRSKVEFNPDYSKPKATLELFPFVGGYGRINMTADEADDLGHILVAWAYHRRVGHRVKRADKRDEKSKRGILSKKYRALR